MPTEDKLHNLHKILPIDSLEQTEDYVSFKTKKILNLYDVQRLRDIGLPLVSCAGGGFICLLQDEVSCGL